VRCRSALSNDLADGPLCSLTRFDRLDPGGQRRGRRRRQRERRHPRATRGTAGAERRFPDHPTLPPILPARPALLPTLTTPRRLSPRGVSPPRVAGRPAPGVALRDWRATPTQACRFTRPGTVVEGVVQGSQLVRRHPRALGVDLPKAVAQRPAERQRSPLESV